MISWGFIGLLVFSIVLNILLIWYVVNIVKKLLFISGNIEDLVDSVDIYSKHLKSVYEMPMFYGDDVLKSLMEHTGELNENLKKYEDICMMISGEVGDDLDLEEEELSEYEDEEEEE